MSEKAKHIIFITIWSVLLIPFVINLLVTGFVLFTHAEGIIPYLIIVFGFGGFISFFAGFLSYIMIAPWLLNKHKARTYIESYIWLNFIYSEIELKKLNDSTEDKSVARTMKLLKYSKIGLVTSILFLLFLILIR